MRRALELAARGRGRTSPNPLVGCVIVAPDGSVVGEGWHPFAGGPHAEAAALAAAGEAARGATAYVTLEPCDHHGRTPPCTEALIAAGVAEVVVAHLDPDPRVSGRGVARLEAAGVRVRVGTLAAEAEALNEAYLTSRRLGRPFVLYKAATTLDGKTATTSGESRWISGEAARERVHAWRDELDAVAVGAGTVVRDDPALTTRLPGGGRTPLKVVFDGALRTPATARLFEPDPEGVPARVVVFAAEGAPAARAERLAARGAEVVTLPAPDGRPDVAAALAHLAGRQVQSLLLEGGGTLAWSFFARRAVDRVAFFLAPKLLGGPAPGPLGGPGVHALASAFALTDLSSERVGDDLLVQGRVVYPEVD
ncbi:MAG TPA: bifunctional diaminohydroxyphosphoribosylaminopyrimidine deaminase/5-amino-6-(5-phosphoribosylamino)uracil reductase RibD [Trueperaceae bacterium]|nr:bifunctional diaminohydroxyphosphoribosylaminopyrimidine deaminase/5-amino-6-(5-phosphoribosylamino)uracil reductase RibD [Trueperaceae bacterium]